jgi:hypothetical protein
MRPHYRIKPFLEVLDISKLVGLPNEQYNKEIIDLVKMEKKITEMLPIIEGTWLESPDLRFGQLLYNMGIGGDYFEPLYILEESDILMKLGRTERESHGWLSFLNKDLTKLDEPIFRFICDLDTDHLQTMLYEANAGKRKYNRNYLRMFEEELESRGFPGPYMTDEGWVKQIELLFIGL